MRRISIAFFVLVSSSCSFATEATEIERLPLIGDIRILASIHASNNGIGDEVIDIQRIAPLEAEETLRKRAPQLSMTGTGESVLRTLEDSDVAVLKLSWVSGPEMLLVSWANPPMDLTGPGALIELSLDDDGPFVYLDWAHEGVARGAGPECLGCYEVFATSPKYCRRCSNNINFEWSKFDLIDIRRLRIGELVQVPLLDEKELAFEKSSCGS